MSAELDMTMLAASWNRAWHGIGASGSGTPVYEALVARYAEPHRDYHTLQHLTECIAWFNRVLPLAARPAEVELALWFHDSIYAVGRSDNEEQSARWAESELTSSGAGPLAAETVRTLVMATRHSALPETQDEKVVVDIDLSILGASDDRFAEYERQIRDEYAFVPSSLFDRRRREILQSFLDRPVIYSTPHFVAALEQKARDNLGRALGKNAI
jgi:predicted metal-dependent HD superfamily phosphohydrolase